MASRLLAGALAVLVALGLAGCGGDDERLTKTQYVKRATQHCEKLLDASNDLRKAQAPGASGKRVAKFLHQAADGLGKLVDGFDSLNPPEKLEADTDELVDVLDGYAAGLDALADRVKRAQTFRVVLEKNEDLVTRLNGIAENATELVSRLGLRRCLLPT